MSNFFKEIKEKTLKGADTNAKEEIKRIEGLILSAANQGLFSVTFCRNHLSEQEICFFFPVFKTSPQKHIQSMKLDWSEYLQNPSSPFYERVQKVTFDAQKEKLPGILNAIKEVITTAAENGKDFANYKADCDFYSYFLNISLAREFNGFTIQYKKPNFSIKW